MISFSGGNNLQTTILNNVIFNYDKFQYAYGTAGFVWPVQASIDGRSTRYKYSGNLCYRYSWLDNMTTDRRTIQSGGPLSMSPGDTQVIVYLFKVASGSANFQSICQLMSTSDMMSNAYYSRLNSSVIRVTQISSNVPVRYGLYQNYPNPFNPKTKIRFDLAGTGGQEVRLIVFDALGQKVSTLIERNRRPGSYETDWDSCNFPSGNYFYRLEAGSFVESKKLILLI